MTFATGWTPRQQLLHDELMRHTADVISHLLSPSFPTRDQDEREFVALVDPMYAADREPEEDR
jgi:hypothetical protein